MGRTTLALGQTSEATEHTAETAATGFDRYRLQSGRIAYANTKAPLFPGEVAHFVSGVIGLDSLSQPQRLGSQCVLGHECGGATVGCLHGAHGCVELVWGNSDRVRQPGPVQRCGFGVLG